ncbi:hypothetical protein LTR28_000316 [Elasticomyces elasticus]|nr:hypothetical protein LTR28_000316 [Elasticomyces elasticus]
MADTADELELAARLAVVVCGASVGVSDVDKIVVFDDVENVDSVFEFVTGPATLEDSELLVGWYIEKLSVVAVAIPAKDVFEVRELTPAPVLYRLDLDDDATAGSATELEFIEGVTRADVVEHFVVFALTEALDSLEREVDVEAELGATHVVADIDDPKVGPTEVAFCGVMVAFEATRVVAGIDDPDTASTEVAFCGVTVELAAACVVTDIDDPNVDPTEVTFCGASDLLEGPEKLVPVTTIVSVECLVDVDAAVVVEACSSVEVNMIVDPYSVSVMDPESPDPETGAAVLEALDPTEIVLVKDVPCALLEPESMNSVVTEVSLTVRNCVK